MELSRKDWRQLLENMEYYRYPTKLEAARIVFPIALAAFAIGLACGYGWAMKAFGG